MTSRAPVDQMVKATHVRRRATDSTGPVAETGPHPLVKLQRQVGNATIARTLAQRQDAPEEDELMAKHDHDTHATAEVGLEGGPISADLSSRIESRRGGGSTLDAGTRSSMETAFGDRFDDVRIHTDDEADRLNRSVSAKAFTTGTDIFFSKNASPSDSTLLSHELAHVVQQRGSSSSGPTTVGPANDAHEHAADAAAGAIASGVGATQRMVETETPDAIAREAAPEEEELPM